MHDHILKYHVDAIALCYWSYMDDFIQAALFSSSLESYAINTIYN